MSDTQAKEVPLSERLRSISVKYVAEYISSVGLQSVSHNVPIGKYAHEAADTIELLERELTAAKRQPDLLMLMAMAPAEEIEGMIGETRASAAQFLGIADEEYEWRKHYHLAIAKARRLWAEAMIREAEGA